MIERLRRIMLQELVRETDPTRLIIKREAYAPLLEIEQESDPEPPAAAPAAAPKEPPKEPPKSQSKGKCDERNALFRRWAEDERLRAFGDVVTYPQVVAIIDALPEAAQDIMDDDDMEHYQNALAGSLAFRSDGRAGMGPARVVEVWNSLPDHVRKAVGPSRTVSESTVQNVLYSD